MSKKASAFKYIIPLVLVIACVCIGILIHKNTEAQNPVMVALGCEAESYSQEDGAGYLTIRFAEKEFQARVEDDKLQDELRKAAIDQIVGVYLAVYLPESAQASATAPFDALLNGDYRDIVALDVYYT